MIIKRNLQVKLLFLLSVFFCSEGYTQVFVPDNNMIANGDFMSRDPQQRPLRWTTGMGLQTATSSAAERHSQRKDDKSLRISDTSTVNSVSIRSEKRIVNPGTKYSASAWVKSKSGKAATFNMEFWDQNNVIIGRKTVTPDFSPEWKQQTIDLVAPDKSTHATVSVTTGKVDTGLSFWDDITMQYETNYDPQLKSGVREIFADNYRIERLVDIQRVVHPGQKSKPLINPTEPWEGNSVYIYGTVLKDEPAGSGYRMWYTSYIDEKYFLCYATSKDGIKWTKPNLGVIEFNGSKENNICKIGGGTLIYDPFDKDASKRYKLMTFEGGKKFGYGVHFSPDGFTWTEHPGNPVLPYGDVSNVAYDKEKGLFIASTKQRMLISNTSVTSGKNDRAAFISVSKDFINWTAPEAPGSLWTIAVEGDHYDDMLVMSKGGIESNIYGMPVYPYESVYIGTPWAFDINTYNTGEFAVTGDGKIQPQLAASRDLKHWSRSNREPLIPLGAAGSWDDGTIYNATTLQVSDKEMSMYYGAMNLPHGGSTPDQVQYARIAKATWRRDGFVSLHNGGDDTGTITTKPVFISGNQLYVNTKLKKGGSLKVEILDEAGSPVEGFTVADSKAIYDDQFARTVSWKNGADLTRLSGKKIKLRFHLTGGNLYSYWVN
ncbi:MAG TPA: carbohydrate binding domain-containing protein [Sphingobacteriaceae bacterium]